MNKFCGEHLVIGNEIEEPAAEPVRKGEPRAEARMSDQQYHHLKILKQPKSNGQDDLQVDNKEARRKNQRIFSQVLYETIARNLNFNVFVSLNQDFRVLKILPSNLDDINSIKEKGDEIVFKTNDLTNNPPSNPTTFTTKQSATTGDRISAISNEILDKINYSPLPNEEEITKATQKTLTTAQSKENVWFPFTKPLATVRPTIATPPIEPEWENEIINENPNIFDSMEIDDVNDNEVEPTTRELISELDNINDNLYKSISTSTTTNKSPSSSTTLGLYESNEQTSVIFNNEDDYSYEDYAIEYNGRTLTRKNKMRIHTSHQKIEYRKQPLMQGFLATTGYPKYYIGESNCTWKITAPHNHKIRLTILDINLRCKLIKLSFNLNE